MMFLLISFRILIIAALFGLGYYCFVNSTVYTMLNLLNGMPVSAELIVVALLALIAISAVVDKNENNSNVFWTCAILFLPIAASQAKINWFDFLLFDRFNLEVETLMAESELLLLGLLMLAGCILLHYFSILKNNAANYKIRGIAITVIKQAITRRASALFIAIVVCIITSFLVFYSGNLYAMLNNLLIQFTTNPSALAILGLIFILPLLIIMLSENRQGSNSSEK